jgi:hypothetical protein
LLLPLFSAQASSNKSNVSCEAAATAVAPASAVGAVRRGETAGAVLVLEDVTVQVSNFNEYTAAICYIKLSVTPRESAMLAEKWTSAGSICTATSGLQPEQAALPMLQLPCRQAYYAAALRSFPASLL